MTVFSPGVAQVRAGRGMGRSAVVAACGFLVVLGLGLAVLTAFPSAALSHECAYEFGSTVQRVGDCETVFDWTTDKCHSGHYPDAPARAFRDAHVDILGLPQERVQLAIPNNKNTRMLGLTLNDLDPEQQRPDLGGKPCGFPIEPLNTTLWNSAPSPDPGQFHQLAWINSLYTEDGRTIYALIHNEYHGAQGGTSEDGVDCLPGPRCEYWAITAAVSTPETDPNDYGRCYGALEDAERTPLAQTCSGASPPPLTPPAHFVAGLPHKYEGSWSGKHGTQGGTNVIKNDDDGYYYAIFAMRGFDPDPENPPDKHPNATCLMRTNNLADPESWRAFGGYGADESERWISFVDPYDPAYDPPTDPPANHFCTNIPNALVSGLAFNTYLNKYMSIGTKGLADAAGPAGVYYSLSDDLRDWSERKLIIKTETNSTFDAAYTARGGPQVPVDLCDLDDPISHPVILDPSDPAGSADPTLNPNGWRNFNHPGRDPYLYLRRANSHSNWAAASPCGYGASDRDLIRLQITFNGAYDLSLSKSSSPDPVLVGQPLTYTLSVQNNGPANASDVTLTDDLPAGMSFNSATPSQGNCTETSGTVACALGPVLTGGSATVQIAVTPQSAGMITNTASVQGPKDIDSSNNIATEQTTVTSPDADLALTETDFPDPVVAGGALTYTLTVQNNGPSAATDVALADNLPAEVGYQSATPSQGNCSEASATVTCDLGVVANGGSATVQIAVTPQSDGTITNTASVQATQNDPTNTNNAASEQTIVGPNGYARPRSATPVQIRVVPAYRQCTDGTRVHGAPLGVVSCGPPTQVSSHLTVGSPDANGRPANSTGFVELKVVGESPINHSNGDQADVQTTVSLTDVLKQSDLSDYEGELEMVATLRTTDRVNGAALDDPATVTDVPLRFTIPCGATPGGEGGACQLTTTADGVMPGIAQEGKRSVWELVDIGIYDGGADGLVSSADNTLFAVPGLFAP